MKHFTLHPYEGKRLLFDIMGKSDVSPIPVTVSGYNSDGSMDCTLNNPGIVDTLRVSSGIPVDILSI